MVKHLKSEILNKWRKKKRMILQDLTKQISAIFQNFNDDPVDRFHNLITVAAVSIYLTLLSGKQYYGNPIECSIGSSFNGHTSNYIHSMYYIFFLNKNIDIFLIKLLDEWNLCSQR